MIVGKTNTPELGQWPITESTGFGVTRNPWDEQLTPGGSSGGSAAAVAAGVVPAALGSDGLGSVRIPAAWTHLVGIKPQRGRISTWPDAESFNGLTCIGPLARTVADAALLLDAAAGQHHGDRHRPTAPELPFATAAEREPRRLRVALSLRIPYAVAPSRLDDEVRSAIERIAGVIEALGHEVEAADPAYGAFGVGALPRSLAGVRQWASRVPDGALLDPRTRHNARVGGSARRTGATRSQASGAGDGLAGRGDLPALRRGADADDGAAADVRGGDRRAVRLADRPQDGRRVSLYLAVERPRVAGHERARGLHLEGAPLGAQLVGPEGAEALLISLAAQLEAQERWHEHRPPNSVYPPDRLKSEERAC